LSRAKPSIVESAVIANIANIAGIVDVDAMSAMSALLALPTLDSPIASLLCMPEWT
jgi:hypothetical protein